MQTGLLQLGIFVMILAGLFNTGTLVFSDVLKQMQWPCYRIFSFSCFLICPFIAIALKLLRSEAPSLRMVRWLLLRPLFACGSFVCCIVAVQMGTPFGDVASLGSINIVAAAFLGRIFLKEPVRVVHSIALVLSTLGAILISKPALIFGGSTDSSVSWLGYVLALLSGLLDALSFVCSRKSADVPTGFIMLGTCAVSTIVLFVMGSIPSLEDHSLSVFVTSPWIASLIIGIGCALTVLCTAACVVGSVLCPAAVSTTVYTSMNLTSGYVAQLLLHNYTPAPLTVSGALLMLIAVFVMVAARKPAELIEDKANHAPRESSTVEEETDDNDSIASFIATEFAISAPHHVSVRQRRVIPDTPSLQVVTVIGI
mmetsp:Transcript_66882/g.105814  ORF Transcript_66882/g.105814 Transcript_66882/m.105814 type:complete len:369 (-) Transcript_66882:126-1232(-)